MTKNARTTPIPGRTSRFFGSAVAACCLLTAAACLAAPNAPGDRSLLPAPSGAAGRKPAPKPLSATEYEATLQRLEAQLRSRKPPKSAPSMLQVRRADGQTQAVDNTHLQRALTNARAGGALPPSRARALSESVKAVRDEAARWRGSVYTAADAKSIVRQLQDGGQIRVGPTALQLWLKSVRDWFSDTLEKISRWIFGNMPAAPTAKMPQIDPRWIKFFFYSCVFSLLALIGYMVWKALGGRIGRRGPQLQDRVLEGEDAELLKLPSDELLSRAARFAEDANFREAVRHRFIATLVRFDERSLWRYNTRRTNREHIALLRDNPARTALAQPLEALARRFDRVRYGNAQASHGDWVRFEADATALENLPAARSDFSAHATGAKGARA